MSGEVEGCGMSIMPCAMRHLAQQLYFDLCPWAELPSSMNRGSTAGFNLCVIAAKVSIIPSMRGAKI